MQSSAAHVRKAKREVEDAKNAIPRTAVADQPSFRTGTSDNGRSKSSQDRPEKQRPTEFALTTTSAPRRLNDIVQAPPELKKLPRGAKSKETSITKIGGKTGSLREGALSMAQKVMLEEEREKAVRLYREMKKKATDS